MIHIFKYPVFHKSQNGTAFRFEYKNVAVDVVIKNLPSRKFSSSKITFRNESIKDYLWLHREKPTSLQDNLIHVFLSEMLKEVKIGTVYFLLTCIICLNNTEGDIIQRSIYLRVLFVVSHTVLQA